MAEWPGPFAVLQYLSSYGLRPPVLKCPMPTAPCLSRLSPTLPSSSAPLLCPRRHRSPSSPAATQLPGSLVVPRPSHQSQHKHKHGEHNPTHTAHAHTHTHTHRVTSHPDVASTRDVGSGRLAGRRLGTSARDGWPGAERDGGRGRVGTEDGGGSGRNVPVSAGLFPAILHGRELTMRRRPGCAVYSVLCGVCAGC